MKIVLLGYGKMGQLIERFAMKRGHEVVLIVDESNRSSITSEDLEDADMAIDFSTPDAALENISLCFESDLPLVVGTTGWYEHLEEVKETCLDADQSLFVWLKL
ncbi:Dihydrodipicolinate reductase [Sphingobacterium daejeonense]|nr:Dihydrodipicolinate reductase [Sphingobacterium daejeonense]